MADTILNNSMLAQEEKTASAASQLAKQRAASLTPEKRSSIAQKAAKARWAKKKRKKH